MPKRTSANEGGTSSASKKPVVGTATRDQILGAHGAAVKAPPHGEGWGTRLVTRNLLELMATPSVIHRT